MAIACTHFEVKDEAETLKNVASDSDATALASIVFPLPGGPKRRRPNTYKFKIQKSGVPLIQSLQYQLKMYL